MIPLSFDREPSTLAKQDGGDALLNVTGAQPAKAKAPTHDHVDVMDTEGEKKIPNVSPDLAKEVVLSPPTVPSPTTPARKAGEEIGHEKSAATDVWKTVSPKKAGRSRTVNESEISSSSGSRYASLAEDSRDCDFDVQETDAELDDDGDVGTDEEDSSKGFFHTQGQDVAKKKKHQDVTVQRSSLPRQSKTNHKVVRDATYYLDSSQVVKEPPSGLHPGSKRNRNKSSKHH